MTTTAGMIVSPPIRVRTTSLSRKERRWLHHSSPAIRDLGRIGFVPFNEESVKRYMERKVRELKTLRQVTTVMTRWSFRHYLASALGIMGAIIAVYNMAIVRDVSGKSIATLIICLAVAHWGSRGKKIKSVTYVPPRVSAAWQKRRLGEKDLRPEKARQGENPLVPKEILSAARRIATAMRGTELTVHQLDENFLLEVWYFPLGEPVSSCFVACRDNGRTVS